MSDETKKPDLKLVQPPKDALDIASLWLDPRLGDCLTETHFHRVPIGKPKGFFRVHKDENYRRVCEIYVHKSDTQIEEEFYIIAPSMRGQIDEAVPCTLVTYVDREGSPGLWPLKMPKEGLKDNNAWISARRAARLSQEGWLRLVWARGAYKTREAQEGYAPEPDWKRLPTFDQLVATAFGQNGIIRDANHPIVRDLFGAAPRKSAVSDALGDDDDDDDASSVS